VSRHLPVPRKRRTREHVIADLSLNHLERFILEEGHAVQRTGSDHGYDLVMLTHDADGYAEPGLVYFQLKATETLGESSDYVYDIDVRDYHLWTRELMPVILVLYDASRRRVYRVHVQGYFRDRSARRPKSGARTIRIRVPRRQAVGRRAVRRMRDLKRPLFALSRGEEEDV
jgi:hypothetical protein